jgi:thiamine biosynthesis lipoprotein
MSAAPASPAAPQGAPAANREAAAGGAEIFGAKRILKRILDSLTESSSRGAHEIRFQAFGTQCRVSISADANVARECRGLVLEWVAAFEAKYSRFQPDSLLTRINEAAGTGWVAIDPDTERIFALCNEMVFLTRGAFDPTALPLIELWNWKNPSPKVPSEAEIAGARELVGWRKVQRAPHRIQLPARGMRLDLGGMGKEYAVDQVSLLFRMSGATGVLVDFGADVRVSGLPSDGRPAWHIGLEDPDNPGRAWCGLAVRDAAVATSGDYFRKFETGGRRYGHIVDLRTGQPVHNDCRAVSVTAPSCTVAGMLSTAAFILGPVDGLKLIESQMGAEGVIIAGRSRHASRRFYEYVVSDAGSTP